MKAEAMAYFFAPHLTVAALGIFFTFFMVMLLWVYQRRRRPVYQHMADLPLGDD